MLIYIAIVRYMMEPYTLKNGIGSPEYRLIPGIVAAAFAPAGMFIFGYSARSDITWVAPTIGIALYAGASFIVSRGRSKFLVIADPLQSSSTASSYTYPSHIPAMLQASSPQMVCCHYPSLSPAL